MTSHSAAPLTIRPVEPADVATVFQLIKALADYEKLAHEVVGSVAALQSHLFGDRPYIEAVLAEVGDEPTGFALFFCNYDTHSLQPGIYLEDLFVQPHCRGRGIGKALLRHLARRVAIRGWGQLEWSVLDWNAPAIAFYRRMGAIVDDDYRTGRLTGQPLQQLASTAGADLGSATFEAIAPAALPELLPLLQAAGNSPLPSALLNAEGVADSLGQALSQEPPLLEVVVARQQGQMAGFAAFTPNYSTFLTKPGIYVENWFVQPEHRQSGGDRAFLAHLAQLAVTRNWGRVEWTVSRQDEGAIAFYQSLGAEILPDWRRCRVANSALSALAAQA